MKQFIQLEDLDDKNFVGGLGSNNKFAIKPKLNPSNDNMLEYSDEGLIAIPKFETPLTYTFNLTNVVDKFDDSPARRRLYSQRNGFGYIHLDFMTKNAITSSTMIAQLYGTQPVPFEHIEVQTNTGGVIWVSKNSRNIMANNLPSRSRVIVDLIGFWKK